MFNRFSSRRAFSAAALGLLLATTYSACSKKDEGTSKQAITGEAPSGDVTLQKTIATMVPEQAVGFFVWQGNHPAYEKLAKSPWGSSETDITKMLQDSSPQVKETKEMLQNVGIDLENKDTFRKLFSEAALFLTPSAEPGKAGSVGLVFRSDPSMKISEKLASLKGALARKNFDVADVKLANGSGFSLVEKGSSSGEKVFIGYKGDIGVFGSSDWVVDSVLSSKGDKVPTVATSQNFARAAKGLPDDSVRFATAYFDFQRMTEVADRLGPAGADSVQKMKSSELPLKALSISMAMDKTPQTNLRLVYDPAQKGKGWLGALNASSSNELLSVLPSKPLVFLSLDGKTLRQVKELALAGMGEAGKPYASQLALLDDVKRVGLSARASAPGQSLIPVPDVLIVVESTNPAQTQQELQTVVGGVMQGSGLPAMPWSDTKVNGVAVKSMMTPFGVGVFLATNNNLVLVASSEVQLKNALGEGKTGSFGGGAPAIEEVFAKEQSLGNVYLNFEEIASLMENMGGMLSMYAPPEGGNQNQLLQPENIQAMKKMGTVVGSVTLEEDAIGIKSFYQQPAPAV